MCARELLASAAAAVVVVVFVAAAAVCKYLHRDFALLFVCIFLRNRLRPFHSFIQ